VIARAPIRRLGIVAILLAAALALAGCAPTAPIATPSPAQVVGTWHHGSDVITFDADGTFTISGMPLGVIAQNPVASGDAPKGPDKSVSGTWIVGSGGTDAGGAPGVQLSFKNPKRIGFFYGLTLIVSYDLPPRLYLFLGRSDSDIRYYFTKS
jgi:hypothetical protein